MAVTTTSVSAGPYLTTGLVSTFPFNFVALTADEVAAYYIAPSVRDELIPASLYRVTLRDNAGSVTFTTPPPAGRLLVLRAAPEQTQAIQFENEGAFLAEVLNEGLDRLAMGLLVLGGRIVPAPVTQYRKSRLPTWDANGEFQPLKPLDGVQGIVTVSPAGQPVTMSLAAITGLGGTGDNIFVGGFDGISNSGDIFDGGFDG